MSLRRILSPTSFVLISALSVAALTVSGCGFERIQQDPLPDALPNGFNLQDLAEIQDNTTLTDDEKRQQIREAIDAPDDADGDRLVNFLFNFNVP